MYAVERVADASSGGILQTETGRIWACNFHQQTFFVPLGEGFPQCSRKRGGPLCVHKHGSRETRVQAC